MWPGLGKQVLSMYTKYTCLYSGTYLLFCMCYPNSVNFIEFLMDFCIYDDIFIMIQITDKMLLHFKLSESGQFLHVDKTCFPRPSHILSQFIIPYTWNFSWYVNFTDFVVSRAAVKIYSMKILPPRIHYLRVCNMWICSVNESVNGSNPCSSLHFY